MASRGEEMARKGYVDIFLRLPLDLHRRVKKEMKTEGVKDLTNFIRGVLDSHITRRRAERAYEK
jgi:hypothetical protein